MLHQSQLQKQALKILPQQIQMLNMYHLNNIELDLRIRDEIDENPLLELQDDSDAGEFGTATEPQDYQDWDEYGYDDKPDYKAENESYLHSNNYNIALKDATDFRDLLREQLIDRKLDDKQRHIAEYLIESLNDNGFLERDLQDIADDISFAGILAEKEDVATVLALIRELEPLGVGSKDIQEFLAIQLAKKEDQCQLTVKAHTLVTAHYHDLRKRNFDGIMDALDVNEEEFSRILKHISKLQLKPVNERYEAKVAKETIIPDLILTVEGDTVMVELVKPRCGSLSINTSLMEAVENTGAANDKNKQTAQYLKSKYSSAMWFLQAVKQREENMLRIMRAIVKRQKEYFIHGDASLLKPMILKNIADEVGLDISTISRVTCNKYVDTPFGYILLKDIFTEGIINEDGQSVSNKVIQISLEEIIREEDKNMPYSDQQLVTMLEGRGIKIARRTVAKYRDILNIPVGEMRKIWARAI